MAGNDIREQDQNPYVSPEATDPDYRSRGERSVLEFYWRHRDRELGVVGLVAKCVPSWCLVLLLMAVMVAMSSLLVGAYAILIAAFAAGAMLGAMARDVGYCWRVARRWPLVRQVLDWKKIATLMETD